MQLQILERHFESDFLFRMCSVAINRVTSLEFILVCYATMLCPFDQLRNGSVVTDFLHFSSTSTSSATSEYVSVPERFGRNEEPANRNEERTSNKPGSAPKMYLNNAQ